MRSSLFGEATLAEAALLPKPEQDEVMPGTWHVTDGDNEYRVCTDEEIIDDDVYWASCTCPHGQTVRTGVARCTHVAAVLTILLKD